MMLLRRRAAVLPLSIMPSVEIGIRDIVRRLGSILAHELSIRRLERRVEVMAARVLRLEEVLGGLGLRRVHTWLLLWVLEAATGVG